MVDSSKRTTLKIMSAAGATAMFSLPAVGSSLPARPLPANTLNIADHNQAHSSFKIQLITGGSSPEDTVIFINETGRDITIKNFLPGIVTQNNQMIDLNSILVNGDIKLKHGYPFATKAARWELLSLGSKHSYLWCDAAVSKLRDSDTGVITLNAVVNNGRVMLTAEHDEVLLS